MSLQVNDQDLGLVSAYAYAVEGGYTGTEEEFTELMASYATVAEEAEESALKSEGNAVGEQDGVPVEEGSPYYHNNSKYYSEQASGSATTASDKASEASGSATAAGGSADSASANALKSEGYAVGKQNGSDVWSGSTYYHNNAKYYSDKASEDATQTGQDRTQTGLDRTQTGLDVTAAAGSATTASASALKAEGYANGKQNGTPVGSGSPYYENNAKYFADEAADSASDAADSAAEAEATLSEYCKASGTVDNALQLASNNGITDQVPYLFRKSVSGNREYDELIGASMAWNQLAPSKNANTYNGVTTSATQSDGSISVTGKLTNASRNAYLSASIVQGHKILVSLNNLKITKGSVVILGNYTELTSFQTDGDKYYFVDNSSYSYIRFATTSVADSEYDLSFIPQVFDITQMLGSTIADYIYTLESGTTGAGVSKLHEWGFCTKPYYAYSAGALQSVNVSAHKMVGFNQWDASEYTADNKYIDLTKLIVGYTYCISAQNTSALLQYKISETSGGTAAWTSSVLSGSTFTLTQRFKDIGKLWIINTSYGPASVAQIGSAKICINLSDPVRNGEYEPYWTKSYPLDSSLTLNGIYRLDANNDLYADGDKYHPSNGVTRRYTSINLGSLNWVYDSANTRFYASISDAKSPNYDNIISPRYTASNNPITSHDVDKQICVYGSGGTLRFYVTDFSYTDKDALKASLNNVYAVYELETETTESADPFQTPQIVDEYGTEEYIDYAESQGTRDVAVPVGHDTRYPTNQVKKLDGLPSDFSTLIAPTEVQMKATRNYTANDFLIVANQLYKVTTNIASGGTITPGSNVTATTLAEQVTALLNA